MKIPINCTILFSKINLKLLIKLKKAIFIIIQKQKWVLASYQMIIKEAHLDSLRSKQFRWMVYNNHCFNHLNLFWIILLLNNNEGSAYKAEKSQFNQEQIFVDNN